MTEFEVGIVITVGSGRRENVELVLQHLLDMTEQPKQIVLVLDGPDVEDVAWPAGPISAVRLAQKHQPGMEQPRNVGVRALGDVTHAWFLDSDIVVAKEALGAYRTTHATFEGDAVMVGPYEWLPGEIREPVPSLYNDWRWPMFRERGSEPTVAELGVALGNFGGNLVWPIEEFTRVGGFHPQLHHGRCEDGELGLRAAAHRIPMSLVAEARGWHLAHVVDYAIATERNARDVPLLNSWHPWVEQQGLVVTDQDGARFDFVCACGEQVNTLEMWRHMENHSLQPAEPELILPDGVR